MFLNERKIGKFLLVLAILFVSGLGWGYVTPTKNASNQYEINSCEKLVGFAKLVNDSKLLTANAIITAQIEMTDACNAEFQTVKPIGDENYRYKGTFDGQGFPISNFHYEGLLTDQNVGLFRAIETGAVIKNVIMENINLVGRKNWEGAERPISVGGIVGWMNGGIVQECYVSGSIRTTGRGAGVGGIVGYMDDHSIVQNCLSTVSIYASGKETYVGGIAGYLQGNSSRIEKCVFDGGSLLSSGSGAVGGVVGSNQGSAGGSSVKPAGDIQEGYFDNENVRYIVGTDAAKDSTTGSMNADEINTPEFTCKLNGGVWNSSTETCSDESENVWGNNGEHITNNGATYEDKDKGDIVFSIVFSANGGTFAGETEINKTLKVGDKISSEDVLAPSMAGFSFDGWSRDPRGAKIVGSLGEVTKSEVFYAVWVADIRVTFDPNCKGRTGCVGTLDEKYFAYHSVISAETVSVPEDFSIGSGEEAQNYKFMGWSRNSDAENPDASLGVAETNVTIYGVWLETKDNYYSVSFAANGHGTAPSAIRVKENESAVKPADPSVDGYTFSAWKESSDCSGEAFDFTTAITRDVSLYACWNLAVFSITYVHSESAKNDNPVSYTIESETIKLSKLEKEGKVFEGWFYDSDFQTPASSIIAGSIGDKVFYGKWSDKKYKVVFLSGNYSSDVIPFAEKTHGVDFVLPGGGFTSTAGYTQEGWSYTDGGDKAFDLGGTLTADEDIVLYPYWEGASRYSITYTLVIKDHEGGKRDSVYYTYKPEMNIDGNTHSLLAAPELEGYSSAGWVLDSVFADKKVYVHTDSSCSKIVGDDGKCYTNNWKIAQIPWIYTDSVETDMKVVVSMGKFTMPDADVSVHAVYDPIAYSIAYENLGDMKTSNPNQYYVTSNTINLLPPTDSLHYVFGGWYDNAGFTGSAVLQITKGSSGNLALFAKWVPEAQITVVYGPAPADKLDIYVGSTATESEIIEKITEAIAAKGVTPSKPSDENYDYVFRGWAKVDENTYGATFTGVPKIPEVLPEDKTDTIVVSYGPAATDTIIIVVPGDATDAQIEREIEEALGGHEPAIPLPTKPEDDDSTYTFDKFEKDENGNYTPVFVGTEKEPSTPSVPDQTLEVVIPNGTENPDTLKVVVPGDATDAQIERAIEDALAEHVPSIPRPTKPEDEDYTYIFDKFVKGEDGTYKPEFIGTEKEKDLVISYGPAEDDTIHVQVKKSATESEIIEKITEAIAAKGVTPSKPSDENYDYVFRGWAKVDENTYGATFTSVPKIPEVLPEDKTDTIVVSYGPAATDTIIVVVPGDATDAQIEREIEEALGGHEPAIPLPTKPEDDDSTYTFDKFVKGEDGIYEPTFTGTEKEPSTPSVPDQTLEVVIPNGTENPDTLKVVVPGDATDAQIERAIEDALAEHVPSIPRPTKPEDEDSTYTFDKFVKGEDGTYKPEFIGTEKEKDLVISYGPAEDDTIHVQVKKSATESEIIEKITEAFAAKGVTPSKPSDENYDYVFRGWAKVDENTYGATFTGVPKIPEVLPEDKTDTIVVSYGPAATDTIIVVVPGDATDAQIEREIEEALGGHEPAIPLPTKPEDDDSTYTFDRFEKDENGNYTPVFVGTEKEPSTPSVPDQTLEVVIPNGTENPDTLKVVVPGDVTDAQIERAIEDALAEHVPSIPRPTKPEDEDSTYIFDKFVKGEDGSYVPTFVGISKAIIYKIVYKMPSEASLTKDVLTYTYGTKTVLPVAVVADDSTWNFLGWFTEENGLGDRVVAIPATSKGKKVLYALFQKTIEYKAGELSGSVQVAYDGSNLDETVAKALEGVVPEGFSEDGVDYVFNGWNLVDGVYEAKFADATTSVQNTIVNGFSITTVGRSLCIEGAKLGARVVVSDLRGKVVAQGRVEFGSQMIEVPVAGSYIVRVNKVAKRVVIR